MLHLYLRLNHVSDYVTDPVTDMVVIKTKNKEKVLTYPKKT